jgi:RNA polymerase sigma-70 factor (ECF subfamily)
VTLSNLEAGAAQDSAAQDATAFVMDEEAFRIFYERTSRPLWAYLSRVTGSAQQADDLLQETYYRFLRARRDYDSDDHRRNTLYRIATNLTRDAHRREVHLPGSVPLGEETSGSVVWTGQDALDRAQARTDVARAFARMKPRERQLLWLAYAQGFTHQEIAAAIGVKAASIKLMLWRARQRIAALLERNGAKPFRETGGKS